MPGALHVSFRVMKHAEFDAVLRQRHNDPASMPRMVRLPVTKSSKAVFAYCLLLPTVCLAASPLSDLTNGEQWTYSISKDEMSGKSGAMACVTSTNELEFSFPYAGGSYGELCLRKGPRFSEAATVEISKGQILCHSFASCNIRIRFDDNKPATTEGREPSDGSARTVFLPHYRTLVQTMKRSRTVMIEAEYYQNGAQILRFDVSGLRKDW